MQTYTFRRQNYNPASPGTDPFEPAAGIALRIRLELAPDENAAIVDVTNGRPVSSDSPWWGTITGADGIIEVTVEVYGREQASFESTIMHIHAEELDSGGTAQRGATHDVTIVPSGQ